MSNSDSARDQFLADIILELSRQRDEDSHAFMGLKGRLTACEVFRKLCFDYPLVEPEDLHTFSTDLESLLMRSATVSRTAVRVSSDSLLKEFYLHSTFVENIQNMCTSVDTSEHAASPVDVATSEASSSTVHFPSSDVSPSHSPSKSMVSAKHSIAAALCISLPNYLLNSTKPEILRILFGPASSGSSSSVGWAGIVKSLHGLVLQGSVSSITGIEESKMENDSGYFNQLQSLLNSFGSCSLELQRLEKLYERRSAVSLQQKEPSCTTSDGKGFTELLSNTSALATTPSGSNISSFPAILEKAFSACDQSKKKKGKASKSKTLSEALTFIVKNVRDAISSIPRMVDGSLDALGENDDDENNNNDDDDAALDTSVYTTEAGRNMELAGPLANILREVWLHTAFLYRDLLLQYPQCVSRQLSPFARLLADLHAGSYRTGADTATGVATGTAVARKDEEMLATTLSTLNIVPNPRVPPSAAQYLSTMILANVAEFLVSSQQNQNHQQQQPPPPSGVRSGSVRTAKPTAAPPSSIIAPIVRRRRQQVLERAAAAVRDYLLQQGAQALQQFVAVCSYRPLRVTATINSTLSSSNSKQGGKNDMESSMAACTAKKSINDRVGGVCPSSLAEVSLESMGYLADVALLLLPPLHGSSTCAPVMAPAALAAQSDALLVSGLLPNMLQLLILCMQEASITLERSISLIQQEISGIAAATAAAVAGASAVPQSTSVLPGLIDEVTDISNNSAPPNFSILSNLSARISRFVAQTVLAFPRLSDYICQFPGFLSGLFTLQDLWHKYTAAAALACCTPAQQSDPAFSDEQPFVRASVSSTGIIRSDEGSDSTVPASDAAAALQHGTTAVARLVSTAGQLVQPSALMEIVSVLLVTAEAACSDVHRHTSASAQSKVASDQAQTLPLSGLRDAMESMALVSNAQLAAVAAAFRQTMRAINQKAAVKPLDMSTRAASALAYSSDSGGDEKNAASAAAAVNKPPRRSVSNGTGCTHQLTLILTALLHCLQDLSSGALRNPQLRQALQATETSSIAPAPALERASVELGHHAGAGMRAQAGGLLQQWVGQLSSTATMQLSALAEAASASTNGLQAAAPVRHSQESSGSASAEEGEEENNDGHREGGDGGDSVQGIMKLFEQVKKHAKTMHGVLQGDSSSKTD